MRTFYTYGTTSSPSSQGESHPQAQGVRRYLIFATASMGLLMGAIDATVVAVAFPHLMRDLHSTVLWAGWTISIYYIGAAAAMTVAGNLADSFGRKKVFLISLVVFTLSSFACGRASDIYTLVLFRFVQGIGGASFLPTVSGIVTDQFPESREKVVGLLSSIFNAGSIIGPNLGGWVVSRFSWRYVFYINLPIGAALILLIVMLLKDVRASSRRDIDFGGAAFFSGAILFLMFGLNLVGEGLGTRSLLPALAMALLLASFCLLLLFFRHEKEQTNPILDLVLLKSKPFVAANAANMFMGAGFFGLFSFVPLYAVSVYKLSTLMSGMILTPRSVGVIFASVVTSFLLKRWGYRQPMVWGLAVVAVATIFLAPACPLWRLVSTRAGVGAMLPLLILACGIGAGIANPAANNACIELMPERVATIMGLRGMFRTVGGALGISLVTLILNRNPDLARGFTTVFTIFGLGLLAVIPLVFLMPAGKKEWA